MADLTFFKKPQPLTLKQIAERAECTLAQGTNPDQVVEDVAGLAEATAKDISWIFVPAMRDALSQTKAGAVITSEKFLSYVPQGVGVLLSEDPHRSYGLAAQMFYPREIEPFISDKAVIDSTATVGQGCRIEAGAVIGANAVIGDACWIQPNAVIGQGVKMGKACTIGPNASVTHCIMGDDVYIYAGARIGQDGFGFAMSIKGPAKVPQLGRVVIGSHVEIGANTTVDRGAMGDTVIGDGTWIDNLVQIAHNVKLGRCCIIVSQVGIAGSCTLGDFVVCGGQVGIAGHLNIGSGAKIAAQSGVMRDVPPQATLIGSPAQPQMDFMRQTVLIQKFAKEFSQGNKNGSKA